MADNVAVTPGTGATFATDDIGGIQYPRVKISQGADGSGTDVSSAAPLNVTLANGSVPSHAVTNAGTFATQVTSIAAGTNNIGDVDVLTVGGQTPAFGSGTTSGSTQRVVIASDQLSPLGQALMAASTPVVIASNQSAIPVTNTPLTNFGAGEYETVAASQTDQILGATGAVGDYLAGLLITPTTTGAGSVSIKDGNGSSIPIFNTGTLSNLVPFYIPLGMVTVNATTPGWKVTTGANVTVIGIGNFT